MTLSLLERIRSDFPLLEQAIEGNPLVYLDSGASALRPRAVVDAMATYEYTTHSNVHRGVHSLSQRATEQYEASRQCVQQWLGAERSQEIVFTRGTTEALNLLAFGWGRVHLSPGDEILLSVMEHHANLIPWQQVARETGAKLRFLPWDPATGSVDLAKAASCFNERTRVLGITHVSNVLGTVLPLPTLIAMARDVGALVVVDGAQWVPHSRVNVRELDCDFYALSAHKMYGPTGIGALYGKLEHLESMQPLLFGGGMVDTVDWESSTWTEVPARLEAGTPPIAAAVGWAAAIDYLERLGVEAIIAHSHALIDYAIERLRETPGVQVHAPDAERIGVVSFQMDDLHPYDLGQMLDLEGIAVRTGHHCAQLMMKTLGVKGTTRASFGIYNTHQDVDALCDALAMVRRLVS